MPVLKRDLAFQAAQPGESAGDWWHLILDTDAPGLYVEHSWRRAATHVNGEAQAGTERYGINDFLSLAQDQAAQPALFDALRELFREAKPIP